MKKSLLKFLYIVLFFAIIPFVAFSSTEKRNFTLVIDAGHGGHDAGAVGSFSKEKNINLNVALAFGKLVEENCPDVKVIYTRKKDVFIPLQGRADIANKNKADLFISVHTNALPNGKQAYGSETYTLGMARASANLAVAKRENSVITMESDYKTTYQGFDPNKAESYVIFEFMQDRFMKQSVDLASCIQKQYASVGRPNKGVHQAGFLVLRNTSMPSVLTELGFITTPQEEAYLNSQQGIAELSQSIYNGFLAYRRQHDRTATSIPQNAKQVFNGAYVADQVDDVKAASKEVAVVPVAAVPTARLVGEHDKKESASLLISRRSENMPKKSANTDTANKLDKKRTDVKNVTVQKQTNQTRVHNEKTGKEISTSKAKNAETQQKAVADKNAKKREPKLAESKKQTANKKESNDKQQSNARTSKSVKNNDKTEVKASQKQKDKEGNKSKKTPNKKSKITYRIQVGAGKVQIETTDPQFKGLAIKRVKEGSLYKYFYGSYTSYAEAQKALRTVKEKMKSAYLVAYEGGKSVALSEARAKEKAQ